MSLKKIFVGVVLFVYLLSCVGVVWVESEDDECK